MSLNLSTSLQYPAGLAQVPRSWFGCRQGKTSLLSAEDLSKVQSDAAVLTNLPQPQDAPFPPGGSPRTSHLDSQSPSQGTTIFQSRSASSHPSPVLHTTSFTLQWRRDLWYGDFCLSTCFPYAKQSSSPCGYLWLILQASPGTFIPPGISLNSARGHRTSPRALHRGAHHTVGRLLAAGDCQFCGQDPRLSSPHTYPVPAQPST